MVTRDDVARHAGVSVAVVSYVVNNKNNVKEVTRQKVLKAIQELGYNPNLAARNLKTKKAGQLGVLFNSLANPFETGISLGLEERARQYGYSLIFHTFIDTEEEKLKTIFMGRTDGILLLGQNLKAETIDYFSRLEIPLYSITTPVSAHPYVKYMDIDWYEAMLCLITHLKKLGHRHIGFMTNTSSDHHHQVRYRFFAEAMKASGLVFQEKTMLLKAENLESAYQVMNKKLCANRQLPFSAMICANDLMAIGLLSACRDFGLSVPEDLSVAGCEDILMASHTTPTLTTVRFPRREIGFKSIEAIMRHTNSRIQLQNEKIDFELIIRQSTGKASK
ncbi:LacI family DNA-binding transcriptional regulator [Paenibacillus aurantius]|uniref:LacI family DNA-binding transcriptional regulator n=1 Tax=Paenibacillus aurantius TaxID=2918900 RepID=A0AA96LH35_9BACL|nr:LacI family DNA-binding transcriptional regulator [Paenibacillus aurantius]WNQ13989.1 LacI family DNA-binding transcriptional regulator [Paenibacillus aurantius]